MISSSYASSASVPLFDCTDSSTKPAQSQQSLKRLKDTATQDKHTRSGKHKEEILARIHRDIQAVAAIEAAGGLNSLSFERAGARTASEPKNEKTRSRRMISPREHNSGTIKGVPTTGRLPPIAIDLYCLRPLLNMPQPQAAQKLGISITSLQMACRRLGVEWMNKWSPQQSEMPATPLSSVTRGLAQSVQRQRAQSDPTQLRPRPGSNPYSRSSEMARRGSKAVLQFQNVQKSRRKSTSSRPDTVTSSFTNRRTLSNAGKDSYRSAKNISRVKPRSNSLPVLASAGHAESMSSYPVRVRVGVEQSSSIFTCLFGLLSLFQMCMRLVMAPVLLVVDACVSSHPPWALSSLTESSVRTQRPIDGKERQQKETQSPTKEVMCAWTPSTPDMWALEALALDYDFSI